MHISCRFLVSTVTGTVCGIIAYIFRGTVTPASLGLEYMEAVLTGDCRMPLWANLIRSTIAVVAIGGGLTVGPEIATVQFVSVVVSTFGQFLRLDDTTLKLFVACGAGAGFSGAFLMPIAGTLFVVEIMLHRAMESFHIAAVLLSAMMSLLTVLALLPHERSPIYSVELSSDIGIGYNALPNALLIAVICGLLGPSLLFFFDYTRYFMLRYIPNVIARMSLAGMIVGALSVFCPAVWGNGSETLQDRLDGLNPLQEDFFQFLLRLVATSVATSACLPNAVLIPIMTYGSFIGEFVGQLLLTPTSPHDAQLWILVSMASLLAASTHAPMTSVLMVFEATYSYPYLLPAVPAAVLATAISRSIRGRSMYAEALGRHHHLIRREQKKAQLRARSPSHRQLKSRDPDHPHEDFMSMDNRNCDNLSDSSEGDNRGTRLSVGSLHDEEDHSVHNENAGNDDYDFDRLTTDSDVRPTKDLQVPTVTNDMSSDGNHVIGGDTYAMETRDVEISSDHNECRRSSAESEAKPLENIKLESSSKEK